MKRYCFLFLFLFSSIINVFPETSETLNLSFVGDVMAHNVNFWNTNFDRVYENVKDIFLADDLSFANLEFPVVQQKDYSTYPLFNVKRDYVNSIIRAGFDIFSMANNHTCDQGTDNILKTLISMLHLKEEAPHPIYFSGLRGNLKDSFRPVIIEKKGYKIGFISVTAFSNRAPQKEYMHVVNYGNRSQAEEFLKLVKEESEKVDLFIISFHAGVEYRYTPYPSKKKYFMKLIDAGADIIMGHHPHVLQPFEILNKEGSDKLILYSTGNFISGQRWGYTPFPLESERSYTGDSAIYKVQLQKNSSGHDKINVEPVLITNHITENRQVVVYKFTDILKQPLGAVWLNYYRERLKLMQKFTKTNSIIKVN